ncbi:MAG TPA: PAS domain-containing protein [Desulfobacterales bacterium]|nr:PAS domain-containing protein [Desulfobacterales bacterium]
MENSGVVITWEGELASLNFLTDITKRKQVEDELRAAHSDLEHLVSSLSSILIELTSDGIVRRWNKVAEEILGLKENQVLSRKLSHLGLAWEIEKILDGLDRCKNTKRPVRLGDIPFVRQDKKRVLLGITINPKTNNTGDLLGFILVGADITEHRVMEAQLLQAQKLESVGQLAAGIAHEINTPIQFVGDNIQFLHEAFADLMRLLEAYKKLYDKQGNCEGLAPRLQEARELEEAIDLPFLAKEVPKAIEQSMEGVRRVAKIVGAMKEFSYPDVEEKTPIDLNHAIENTVIVAKNEWKYVAELITDLDPNLPPVPCLPGEFNQVILNLIINAAHAISDVVKEQEGKKGKITITTRRIEDWVEIRVSDTGTGIPEEIRDRIFDPFFTTKEVGKGTGQGLAIARSMVVNKHKGSIEFETEVGKGTTFIIRLPLKEKG